MIEQQRAAASPQRYEEPRWARWHEWSRWLFTTKSTKGSFDGSAAQPTQIEFATALVGSGRLSYVHRAPHPSWCHSAFVCFCILWMLLAVRVLRALRAFVVNTDTISL